MYILKCLRRGDSWHHWQYEFPPTSSSLHQPSSHVLQKQALGQSSRGIQRHEEIPSWSSAQHCPLQLSHLGLWHSRQMARSKGGTLCAKRTTGHLLSISRFHTSLLILPAWLSTNISWWDDLVKPSIANISKNLRRGNILPKVTHISALISFGPLNLLQAFEEMKAYSKKNPQCTPNVITYSALMTACCSGGMPDEAHKVFKDMIASGIKPDQISYSTLIAGQLQELASLLASPSKSAHAEFILGQAIMPSLHATRAEDGEQMCGTGYERWGDTNKSIALYNEMVDAGLGPPYGTASYLEQFSRKLQRSMVSPFLLFYSGSHLC